MLQINDFIVRWARPAQSSMSIINHGLINNLVLFMKAPSNRIHPRKSYITLEIILPLYVCHCAYVNTQTRTTPPMLKTPRCHHMEYHLLEICSGYNHRDDHISLNSWLIECSMNNIICIDQHVCDLFVKFHTKLEWLFKIHYLTGFSDDTYENGLYSYALVDNL